MMKVKTRIIPIFVPHYGCPHDCYFCNQKSITGHQDILTIDTIQQQLESRFQMNRLQTPIVMTEIAFFGGSFTAIPVDDQEKLLSLAHQLLQKGDVDTIRISTRPDAIDERNLQLLKDKGVGIIELGVQSMDNQVLRLMNRGHTAEDTIKASKLIKNFGFKLGHQIMPGLYGSSLSKDLSTMQASIDLKPNMVRIYPTLVIKNTKLENLYHSGDYKPLELNESIRLVAYFYTQYWLNQIEVIKMGLQASDTIAVEGDVVAGPFHPAYGQMVKTHIMLTVLLDRLMSQDVKSWTIIGSKKIINEVVGVKKKGAQMLKSQLNLDQLIYQAEENIDGIIIKDIYNHHIHLTQNDLIHEYEKITRENINGFKRNYY